MSKFKFSLENALKYRQSIEEKEIYLLARAMQNVYVEENASNMLNLEKERHLSTYDLSKLNLTTMQQNESYLTSLDLRIINQMEKLEQAKGTCKNQRDQAVIASTKRKTLERLKEKHLDEHRLVLSKAEQNLLDDIGIVAYCRASN